MNRSAIPLLLSLLVSVGAVAGQEDCKTLATAAMEGGLTFLGQAVAAAVPSLEKTDEGSQLEAAIDFAVEVPESMRVTLFAPDDAALQSALQELSSTKGSTPGPDEIAAVLLNHVVAGDLTSTAIKNILGEAGGSTIVPTLLGSELYVTTDGDDLYVQSRGLPAPGARVVSADIITCVGPVHVVDQVLLPSDSDEMTVIFADEPGGEAANGGLAPAIAGAGQACSSVGTTAVEAGLDALIETITTESGRLKLISSGVAFLDALSKVDKVGDDRLTVFAPTDQAFTEAAQKFGGELPESAVADVLLNHAVLGDLTAATITSMIGSAGGSIVIQTLLGEDIYVSTSDSGIRIQSRGLEAPGALVVTPDVDTCVGPVHVIDAVLLPTLSDGTKVTFNNEGGTPQTAVDPGTVDGQTEADAVVEPNNTETAGGGPDELQVVAPFPTESTSRASFLKWNNILVAATSIAAMLALL